MNKEDALKMAQTERIDDLELQVKDKSIMWSYLATIVLVTLFSFSRVLHGFLITDLTATICASICVNAFYRYLKTRKQQDLFLAVAMFIIVLVTTIHFFIGQQPMSNKLKLKNNVKQSRLERSLSQATLVKLVGVSRNTISSIGTGQFSPTIKLALLLCTVLDKKFEDLLYS